jgi:hydrogenase maturation protease
MKLGIFCCGNLILGDDGFGIHVLRKLQKRSLPDYVHLFDVGLSGWNLLTYLGEYDKAIIIDAINYLGNVGRIHRLHLEDLEKSVSTFSTHRMGLNEILILQNFQTMNKIPELLFIGAEIQLRDFYTDILSKELLLAVEEAVKIILTEINQEVVIK